jgi:hypothetical protein
MYLPHTGSTPLEDYCIVHQWHGAFGGDGGSAACLDEVGAGAAGLTLSLLSSIDSDRPIGPKASLRSAKPRLD